jgi:transcription elongation factor Elf1
MSEAEEQLVAVCPNCQKAYTVKAKMVGRYVTCKKCEQSFQVQGDQRAVPAGQQRTARPASAAASSADATLLCPICQCALGAEPSKACAACHTRHHVDCWEYNRGCGLYGCANAPETEKLQEIEIPASFWGQTEKKCPKCANTIQAAALRCRFCGLEFNTARPQATSEFQTAERQTQSVALHRKIGVTLLVLAIIPCTAPLAAVVGIPWYFIARKPIAAMPGLNATICRMAVIIAIAVTGIMIVIASVYSAFNK